MSKYKDTLNRIVKDREFLSIPCVTIDEYLKVGGPDDIEECIADLMNTARVLDKNKNLKCAGLAANQLGYSCRVLVIKKGKKFKVFVNPVILKTSEFTTLSQEGCFSFPGRQFKTTRHNRILVKGDNTTEIKLSGKESFAFQHEMDHLNGILR